MTHSSILTADRRATRSESASSLKSLLSIHQPRRLPLLLCLCFWVAAAQAGTVISTNLPPDTKIVNIDARADGAGTYSNDSYQSFWYQPNASAPSITLPAGTYRFRIIDRKDAASIYSKLTSSQLDQIYTAWTYNSPWTDDYLVFKNSALNDSTEPQLFDGAISPGAPGERTYSSAQEAYDATKANGYFDKIRPAPPGRAGTAADFRSQYTFAKQTTIVFVLPDSGLFDNGGGVSVVVSPAPSVFANISTRLKVETGDNALIGGFFVTGKQPKKVIIRALGPSLSASGHLNNPTLELHGASGLIAANDNWKSRQQAAIMATGIAPKNNLESAIVATLPGNNAGYSAILRGVNNETGIGSIEVYDLAVGGGSKLANISTRGVVGEGDNVLIGGLIVAGGKPLKAVFRGIGPSLAAEGVSDPLQDPILEVHDHNGEILATNDNWQTDPAAAEIEADGIAPKDPNESATLQTLTPGLYTAVVRGVNGTGVGLVEAYNIQ